jgi:hypothetical protein
MCYSALVNQNLKQLKLQFKARVDTAGFKDLFESRLNGNKITIPKALEHSFTEHPETSEEKKNSRPYF